MLGYGYFYTQETSSVSSSRTNRQNIFGANRSFILILIIFFIAVAFMQARGLMNDDTAKAEVAELAPFSSSKNMEQPLKVIVKPGDTLWHIAIEHAPEGSNLNKYIYEMKKINELDTNFLQIGQVLMLP